MHHLFFTLLAATDAAPSGLDSGLDAVKQIFGPFGVKPIFLLAQIINFGVVASVVYYFAIRPILATVDQRNKTIAAGLKHTEDMKKKLTETEQLKEETLKKAAIEAQKIIAESRESGKALVDKATGDAARQAAEIVKKGNEASALEHQKMLADLRREVAQLVVSTTSRILGRDLTPDERSRFTTSAAQDLSKN